MSAWQTRLEMCIINGALIHHFRDHNGAHLSWRHSATWKCHLCPETETE